MSKVSHQLVDNEDECGEMDIPTAFLCPITLQIMNNPATDTSSGHSFERETIMEWLERGHRTNPLTRRPLFPSDLVADKELLKKIVEWKVENGYPCTTPPPADEEEAKPEPIPWYRQRPQEPQPDTMFAFPSMMPTNPFIERLMEAQRRDAEYHKRIYMALRNTYNDHHS